MSLICFHLHTSCHRSHHQSRWLSARELWRKLWPPADSARTRWSSPRSRRQSASICRELLEHVPAMKKIQFLITVKTFTRLLKIYYIACLKFHASLKPWRESAIFKINFKYSFHLNCLTQIECKIVANFWNICALFRSHLNSLRKPQSLS